MTMQCSAFVRLKDVSSESRLAVGALATIEAGIGMAIPWSADPPHRHARPGRSSPAAPARSKGADVATTERGTATCTGSVGGSSEIPALAKQVKCIGQSRIETDTFSPGVQNTQRPIRPEECPSIAWSWKRRWDAICYLARTSITRTATAPTIGQGT